jgi:hypothetical protein
VNDLKDVYPAMEEKALAGECARITNEDAKYEILSYYRENWRCWARFLVFL